MDILPVGVSLLSLLFAGWAFWRTLEQDRIQADFSFEWSGGQAWGRLSIDNPLRRSVYLLGIRFKVPKRDQVSVLLESTELRETVEDVWDAMASPGDDLVLIRAHIPPKSQITVHLTPKSTDTALKCTLVWGTGMPLFAYAVRPRRLSFSAAQLKEMRHAARRRPGRTSAA